MYETQISEEMRKVQAQIAAIRRRYGMLAPDEIKAALSAAHHAVDDVISIADKAGEKRESEQAEEDWSGGFGEQAYNDSTMAG